MVSPEKDQSKPEGSQKAVEDMLAQRRRNAQAEQVAATDARSMPMRRRLGRLMQSLSQGPGATVEGGVDSSLTADSPSLQTRGDELWSYDRTVPGVTAVSSPGGNVRYWVMRPGSTEEAQS